MSPAGRAVGRPPRRRGAPSPPRPCSRRRGWRTRSPGRGADGWR